MVSSKNKPQTYVVTSLTSNVKEERLKRMWKYSIMMGLRMVAIILMLFIPCPYNLIPIMAAIFLPWFAVVIANQINSVERSAQLETPLKSLEK